MKKILALLMIFAVSLSLLLAERLTATVRKTQQEIPPQLIRPKTRQPK